MSNPIQHVTSLDDYIHLTGEIPCVVKFTAPAWCGPCRMLAPKYEELAEKYGHLVTFIVIDIDHASAIARHMMIRSVPMIVFYQDGVRKDDLTVQGYVPAALETNVEIFVNGVLNSQPAITPSTSDLHYLTEDNIVESSEESAEVFETEEDLGVEETLEVEGDLDHDSDSAHNEYGQDCEFVIEKTIELLE